MPPVDIPRLLHAIAQVETSGGRNNWPRLEVAYMPTGQRYTVQGRLLTGTGTAWNAIVAARWGVWGLASAASWGPWQVLFHTAADRGYDGPPWDLMDTAISEIWVRRHLAYLQRRGAQTVEEFADAYNSGTHRDRIIPHAYIADVVAAYQHDGGTPC